MDSIFSIFFHFQDDKPRKATPDEIETLIGDSAGYEKLMPEQSVVGCIKFEIPEDAIPVSYTTEIPHFDTEKIS